MRLYKLKRLHIRGCTSVVRVERDKQLNVGEDQEDEWTATHSRVISPLTHQRRRHQPELPPAQIKGR